MAAILAGCGVGGGFIDRAWAITFARAGWEMRLLDLQAGVIEACLATRSRWRDRRLVSPRPHKSSQPEE